MKRHTRLGKGVRHYGGWLFGSPCCPAMLHAGVSATHGCPLLCRSARRPKGRRARQRATAPC
eukprot:scaffold4034_cov137-Isochrysis_galbana.AAC.2